MTRCLSVLALTSAICFATAVSAEEPAKKGQSRDPAGFFKKLDGNNDGSVTKAEFSKFFEQMAAKAGKGDGKGGFADKIFEKLDANNDGKLTQDEMKGFGGGFGAGKGDFKGKGKPGDGKGKGKAGDGKGKGKGKGNQ